MKLIWIHCILISIVAWFVYCQDSTDDETTFSSIWHTTTSNSTNSSTTSAFELDSVPNNLKEQFLCLSCTASSLGEDQPNANCTEPLESFVQAVTKGVDVIPCETKQCYTDVIRLGDYLSVFRGCRQQNEDLISFKIHTYDSYNCTRLTLLGKAMWWSCSCEGSLCNNQLPPV